MQQSKLSRPWDGFRPTIVQDGVIPRTALPQILSEIEKLSVEIGLRVVRECISHAGDGNLHPLVLHDWRVAG
jgi:glycolate oxidase